MLNIVCVKQGQKYSAEYVNILFDMVARNLPDGFPGKFVCFTDDSAGLATNISIEKLPPGINGWWNKLALFRKEAFPKGNRILYFDLDTIIVGQLDELVKYSGKFGILKDFFKPTQYGSAVMMWTAGEHTQIWNRWILEGRPELPDGDQEWIQIVVEDVDYFQDLYPGAICSYKLNCQPYPPRGTKVVCLHGNPKPHEAKDKWIADVWKIDGGQGFDLEYICNTEDDKIVNNIRLACKRDVPWLARLPQHNGHAVIVGGAPSLKKHLDEIRWRKSLGQKIFALNNAFQFLANNGIDSDFQVVLDARPENANFIPFESKSGHYFASQCHADVFDRAKDLNVTLFHSYTGHDSAIENPEGKPECLIGGGNTVGLTTMALAYTLGFRTLHLYGMDSSYSEGEHHAYEQTLNDHDRPLDVHCNGRDFHAAAWMIGQANQFQEFACTLAELDCIITVQGDGLLPWVARQLQVLDQDHLITIKEETCSTKQQLQDSAAA